MNFSHMTTMDLCILQKELRIFPEDKHVLDDVLKEIYERRDIGTELHGLFIKEVEKKGQCVVAKIIGSSQPTVSNIVNKKTKSSLDAYCRYLGRLGYVITFLIDEKPQNSATS